MKARLITVFMLCLFGGVLFTLLGSSPRTTDEATVAFSVQIISFASTFWPIVTMWRTRW